MDEPDYGPAEEEESESYSMNSTIMNKANELVNSDLYEAIANEDVHPEHEPAVEQRPRIATRAQAKFMIQFSRSERQCLMQL